MNKANKDTFRQRWSWIILDLSVPVRLVFSCWSAMSMSCMREVTQERLTSVMNWENEAAIRFSSEEASLRIMTLENGKTDRQTDRKTDRQTDKLKDKQTDDSSQWHKSIHVHNVQA